MPKEEGNVNMGLELDAERGGVRAEVDSKNGKVLLFDKENEAIRASIKKAQDDIKTAQTTANAAKTAAANADAKAEAAKKAAKEARNTAMDVKAEDVRAVNAVRLIATNAKTAADEAYELANNMSPVLEELQEAVQKIQQHLHLSVKISDKAPNVSA